MRQIEDLIKLITDSIETSVKKQNIKVFGYQYNYETSFIKSLSTYWFAKHNVEEWIAPLNSESSNNNRPGTIKESTEYIVVHDTASAAPTADEFAHAKYVSNGGGGTSWHYSVGEKMSCHQIPDNEVAYHAGDSLMVRFELFDSGLEGTNSNPVVGIQDGFYTLDNQKTKIRVPHITYIQNGDKLCYASDNIVQSTKAPLDSVEGDSNILLTTKDINDAGIRVSLIDNKYYLGPTYYNATYKKISNRGGNLNSIGIETMVNDKSSLIHTWHRCAKLVAHLLIDNNLDLSRVKPHHFFSGKNCPMTLRENNLWQYFLEMVKVEYTILHDFKDAEISLICDNPMINNDGTINLELLKEEVVDYQIEIKYNKERKLLKFKTKITL